MAGFPHSPLPSKVGSSFSAASWIPLILLCQTSILFLIRNPPQGASLCCHLQKVPFAAFLPRTDSRHQEEAEPRAGSAVTRAGTCFQLKDWAHGSLLGAPGPGQPPGSLQAGDEGWKAALPRRIQSPRI